MINIATVHYGSPKWLDVQAAYLARHLDQPYQVFASLDGFGEEPSSRQRYERFLHLDEAAGHKLLHEVKLNQIAHIIADQADPDDLLVFLDGDAFPIRSWTPWLYQLLDRYPLVAVQRLENLGDCQPHPSFCATTVGFWSDLDGDWQRGGTWTNREGAEVTDVGGNLLHQLWEKDIAWLPLVRTNTFNPHPIWYGIYGHRVYHHGAGFRRRLSRYDELLHPRLAKKDVSVPPGPSLGDLVRRGRHDAGGESEPLSLPVAARATKKTLRHQRLRWYHWRWEQVRRHEVRRAEARFAQLVADPHFYEELDADADADAAADAEEEDNGVGTKSVDAPTKSAEPQSAVDT